MSAQALYDTAPLGAVVRYFDCEPEPPGRHKHKHRAWRRNNGVGRLIGKAPGRQYSTRYMPATITLHEGDLMMAGVVAVVVHTTHFVTSTLVFEVVETLPAGVVLCLSPFGDGLQVQHLAQSRAEAALWHERDGRFGRSIYQEVQPDGSHRPLDVSDLGA